MSFFPSASVPLLITNASPNHRCSHVTNKEEACLNEDKNDFWLTPLRQMLESMEEKEKEEDELIVELDDDLLAACMNGTMMRKGLHSRRGPNPLSDFDKGDKGLATSFPHDFMLGVAHGKSVGSFTQVHQQHLLNQFTLVPAHDRRLLGFLFDAMQRVKVVQGVEAHVECNEHALNVVGDLLNDPEERKKLKEAIERPGSELSKKVLRKCLSVLRFAGKDVAHRAVEGTKLKFRSLGSGKRCLLPVKFLTLSPKNMSTGRSVRMSF